MTILLKTDEDNDIYESPYGKLFDELNLAVDVA